MKRSTGVKERKSFKEYLEWKTQIQTGLGQEYIFTQAHRFVCMYMYMYIYIKIYKFLQTVLCNIREKKRPNSIIQHFKWIIRKNQKLKNTFPSTADILLYFY